MSEAHTIAVGDTHGYWPALLRALWHFKPRVCLVAGDFGWWPAQWKFLPEERRLGYLLENRPRRTEIRFIDGNHEDLDELFGETEDARRLREAVELRPGLWYQPRGSLCGLADGRKVFCAGGGKSVDWKLRIEGLSWFPQEILRREELPETLPEADVVLSHAVPNRLGVLETLPPVPPDWDPSPDPSCEVLDRVFDEARPKLWIASHLHLARRGEASGCRYAVLDRTDGGVRPWEDFVEVLVP